MPQTDQTTTPASETRTILPPRAPPCPYLRLLSLEERRSECVDRIPGSTLVVRSWLRECGASRPSRLSSPFDLLRYYSVFVDVTRYFCFRFSYFHYCIDEFVSIAEEKWKSDRDYDKPGCISISSSVWVSVRLRRASCDRKMPRRRGCAISMIIWTQIHPCK